MARIQPQQLLGPSKLHRRSTDGSFLVVFVIWFFLSVSCQIKIHWTTKSGKTDTKSGDSVISD